MLFLLISLVDLPLNVTFSHFYHLTCISHWVFMRINVYGQENNKSTSSHVFHGSFLSSTKSQTMRIPPLQYPVYDYMPLYCSRRAVQVHRNLRKRQWARLVCLQHYICTNGILSKVCNISRFCSFID